MLTIAILAVSGAGTLVRLAPGAHPLAVAFWRTAIVAVLLAPGLHRVAPRTLAAAGAAGLLLALHFWAWFASLGQTTVLRSTVLVCLTPLWVGVLEVLFLRARPGPRYWAGLAVALGGVGWLAFGAGGEEGRASLLGDGLALVGGLLSSAYLVIGRVVRPVVAIGAYGSLVCGAAALVLGLLALVVGAPFGPGEAGWWPILLLALGPQLLGHIGFNYAVAYVPARVVAMTILLEPPGGAIAAALLLGELPTTGDLVGAVVILAGVGLALPRGEA